MSDIEETVNELTDIKNALDAWEESMLVAIDSESFGARAERASAKVRRCVENCRKEFAAIHREFER